MTLSFPGMSSHFCDWQRLTDLYAVQLTALERREPGAADALLLTVRELELCTADVQRYGASDFAPLA